MKETPGKIFRQALQDNSPLPIVGAINAYSAMMAEKIGHKSLYLSGGGVAYASNGLPDLGITDLHDVLAEVEKITEASTLPLLVDIDTGWGGFFNIARTIKLLIKYNAAAAHIEDQVAQKRCGHRPNKLLVDTQEMVDRIKAAVDARTDENFFLIARTDALAVEGIEKALERAELYIEAGADGIFAEALHTLNDFQQFCSSLSRPVLANITEFGKTPLFTQQELCNVGVAMVLYPLSAFRAMNKAAEKVYTSILHEGHQKYVVDSMQTREELYQYLNYYSYEDKMDTVLQKKK